MRVEKKSRKDLFWLKKLKTNVEKNGKALWENKFWMKVVILKWDAMEQIQWENGKLSV